MSDTLSARAKPPEAKPKPKKKSNRKKLYALHSWLGFHLALIMAVVLATGTIATVSHEIDWLFQHDMRVSPDGEKVSWGEMQRAVQAYQPKGQIISLGAMEGDHFAYRARVVDEYGRHNFIHVNQWTGDVTGETHPLTVQRVFRDLHRYLFMPNFLGLPIVTSLAFILAISLYTGLKTTRNWRTLLFRVRTDKGARILWGDAHKAAGLWSIWFFVVIVVTGVWYLIEFGVGVNAAITKADPSEYRPRLIEERVMEFGAVIEDRPLDEVVAAARAAYPELRISNILIPSSPTAPFTVQGKVGNPMIRERSNAVYLDPESLEVLKVLKWKETDAYFALNELADPLHFGFFGGLSTKLIWFVFGVGMTGLSVTGVWLTWRRLKGTSLSKAQFATMPVLLLSMFFCTQWYGRLQGPALPNSILATTTYKLANDLTANVASVRYKKQAALRVEVMATSGRPLVERVELLGESSEGTLSERPSVRGVVSATILRLDNPAPSSELRIHFADGSVVDLTNLSAD